VKTAREILESVYQAGLYHSKEKDVDIALKELRELAPNKEELRTIIVKYTSEMLDNPDEYGIYPTTKFYNNLISAISKRLKESKL